MDLTPARTVLDGVRILHERGWSSLRVRPELYAIGTWRCWLVASGHGSGGRPLRVGL